MDRGITCLQGMYSGPGGDGNRRSDSLVTNAERHPPRRTPFRLFNIQKRNNRLEGNQFSKEPEFTNENAISSFFLTE